jgi:poly(hydroxyalkanoate) depolymerase family esterase
MPFANAMTEALRLTRSGDLDAAARLIRDSLSHGGGQPPAGPTIDLRPARARTEPTSGGGAQDRSWTGPAGTIGYRLHMPPVPTQGLPVVVMLHGCTQSPEDFARGTGMDALADREGFIVVYPRQTASANAQKCWNWFDGRHQQRDGGEPSLIAGLVGQVLADTGADPARVYVAGLSAGGAAAAIMAEQYPDVFAAVGIHSGIACGAARDLPSALSAMKRGGTGRRAQGRFVPTITFHGDRDNTVGEVNSRQIVAAATAAFGTPLDERSEQGVTAQGRHYTRMVARDPAGRPMVEQWTVAGAGHAWSGGNAAGSFTDPAGPDASTAMLRFFGAHVLGQDAADRAH